MKQTKTIVAGAVVAVTVLASGIAAMSAFAAVPTTANLGANAAVSASANTGAVNANVDATTSVSVKTAALTRITSRADQEITRRLNALNALSARVNQMERLSSDEKSSLSASISAQITAMNDLQTKVAADAATDDTTSLKADVTSITASYRIFALVLPQGAIEAASDRVLTIVGVMQDLSTKLSARISAAASVSGNNVTAAQASLTDLNAKVTDASAQAMAANSEVASLMPDNGNATIEASNTASLKDARSKIQTAQQDLIAARTDAVAIVKDLAGFKGSVSASATSSASATAE